MVEHDLEKLEFFRVLLKEAPAKGVDKEEDDTVVLRGEIPKYIKWQSALPLAREEVLDSARNIGEAVAVIEGLDELL